MTTPSLATLPSWVLPGLSVDINERRLALTRANENGLNVKWVAILTAERTIEKVLSVSIRKEKEKIILIIISFPASPSRSLSDECLSSRDFHCYLTPYLRVSTSNRPLTSHESETPLLRSIKWTMFSEATYDIALEQHTVQAWTVGVRTYLQDAGRRRRDR